MQYDVHFVNDCKLTIKQSMLDKLLPVNQDRGLAMCIHGTVYIKIAVNLFLSVVSVFAVKL